jgi:hypothetical protein
MKLLLISLLTLMSATVLSANHDQTCLSHGDCQALTPTTPSYQCFIINTGTDNQGNKTCALRCYSADEGSFCVKAAGKVVGLCERENFSVPIFDQADPNRCQSAIDPIY